MSEVADREIIADDLRRRELGQFLRARRQAISPDDIGLPRVRRRRTPGLRREEVAYLAGISAKWYARLEMAHDVTPSMETVLALARSLRLTVVETEYVLELAGFGIPRFHESQEAIVPEALEQVIPAMQGAGAVLFDRYVTALRWNAVADSILGIASLDPSQRNGIRRLFGDARLATRFGEDFEQLARGVVGMFRRAYLTAEPTPFARGLYEDILAHPQLARLWDEHVVAEDAFEGSHGPFVRHHPVIGSYSIVTTNMIVSRHQGTWMRIMVPADAASVEQFKRLAELGSPSTRETRLP